jgi:4'-phosphopantetheinyl transferase EntD
MALMSRILVPGIFGAEMQDVGQELYPFPAEEMLMETWGQKRRRDFALGRACARAALSKLGYDDVAIGRDKNGAPLWPQGVVGSIAHTTGYGVALVARLGQFSGVGVDAERMGGVTQNLWPRLFDAQECDHLIGLEAEGQKRAATLFFSAKEASHKAWGIKSALVFRDIHIAPRGDGFAATRGSESLEGRYAVEGDLILTAAWL